MGKQIHIFEVSDFEASLGQNCLGRCYIAGNENQDTFVGLVIAAQNCALLKALIRGSLNFMSSLQ